MRLMYALLLPTSAPTPFVEHFWTAVLIAVLAGYGIYRIVTLIRKKR